MYSVGMILQIAFVIQHYVLECYHGGIFRFNLFILIAALYLII